MHDKYLRNAVFLNLLCFHIFSHSVVHCKMLEILLCLRLKEIENALQKMQSVEIGLNDVDFINFCLKRVANGEEIHH